MLAFPKEVTVETMTTRHIGIESELRTDVEAETFQSEISKHGLLASIGYDGGGREFRTRPISVRSLKQVRGYKYLTEYYEILKSKTAVTETGGTHIHISIMNSDHENMESDATALAITFFDQFQKISGRQTNWARKFNLGNVATLTGLKNSLSAGKNGRVYPRKGSMLNPTRHQTLEFRGPAGSNNSTEILAWIEFLNNVVNVSNRESIEGVAFKRLLRGKRIQEYISTLTGWRQLSEADLNKKFNGNSLV